MVSSLNKIGVGSRSNAIPGQWEGGEKNKRLDQTDLCLAKIGEPDISLICASIRSRRRLAHGERPSPSTKAFLPFETTGSRIV
jgi:hypothetical protein